jgi:hypothetical protein
VNRAEMFAAAPQQHVLRAKLPEGVCRACGGLGYLDRDDTDSEGRYRYEAWDCPDCAPVGR